MSSESDDNGLDKTQSFRILAQGTVISHYKIIEKIGSGGMGVVYKAKDTRLERTVALKFLPSHLLCDVEAKTRFEHEAKAASALNHTNIATIYDIDKVEDQCFISMEYVEGKTLKELIRERTLSVKEALDIALQMAEGLNAAHKKDIVHRDIKSDNIILTDEGVVKIMDFGLAKLKGVTKLTKTGTTLGTIQYMSPEQAQGMEVDQRSDIFSFGVVLYEMITGQLPFKGEHEAAVIYSIVNETPEPLARYKANVPEGLQRIIDKALEKDLSTRYQIAAEIIADFKRFGQKIRPGGLIVTEKKRIGEKSIAVIPFINLSEDKANEYFSDGITEDIITQLFKIGDLKVISRTSAMLYKGSKKSLREIGKELGVATILEGSVRRAGNRVRIVGQLVDAETDEHIWAETYDRDLSDIFAIQSDVAQQIARALKATLSPEEKQRIEQKLTDNLEAYDYFLQGREYRFRSTEKNDVEIAIELYEKAVSVDPNFAEAYASIALQHCMMYWLGYDRSPERLGRAKEAIDKALNLKPDEPVVREANGYYYYHGFRDYARALDEFSFARRKEPGNAWYNANIAFIQRRLGKFEDALQNLKIAFQYDPRSNILASEVGGTYMAVRMYTEAEGYYERAIALAPDVTSNYIYKALTSIYKTGSTESARQVLHRASKRVSSDDLIWYLVYFDIYDGHYQDAFDRLASIQEEVCERLIDYTPKEAIRGLIYELIGQPDQARAHYIKARTLLEKKVHEWSDDARIHAELGKVYARLGLRNEAIREGQTAVDLIPVSRDAMIGPAYLADLAEIYTIVGDFDAAMDKLEYLLEIPSGVHIGELKVNPVWDPLRDHPRFQKLLEGGA
ncbi:MAG: protein kinase [candidate division Zixibacteria bacterium]|nr:protein kinase [candidate division Zixibacteria bacterium]